MIENNKEWGWGEQNFILWVADVRTTEGINCARLLGCTTYPHISIVNSNSSSNEPHLLAHIMGPLSPLLSPYSFSNYHQPLSSIIISHYHPLSSAIIINHYYHPLLSSIIINHYHLYHKPLS